MNDTHRARDYPPAWRVGIGLIFAPALAALLMAVFIPGFEGLPPDQRFWNSALLYAIFGAYPPTLLLGIPAYFILRRHLEPTFRNCSLVGAALPVIVWGSISVLPIAAESESVAGVATIRNGHRTLYGWELVGQNLLLLAAVGVAAGIAFRLIVVGWRRRSTVSV